MDKEFVTSSPEETIAEGRRIAAQLEAGDVVCLEGGLGAGKTHLAKGIAAGLAIDPARVQSPTYTLIHEYYDGKLPFYHFDCYRMSSPQEAREIGAEEYFYGEGICVIEWPEHIAVLIPPEALWISITAPDEKTRKFVTGKKSL